MYFRKTVCANNNHFRFCRIRSLRNSIKKCRSTQITFSVNKFWKSSFKALVVKNVSFFRCSTVASFSQAGWLPENERNHCLVYKRLKILETALKRMREQLIASFY